MRINQYNDAILDVDDIINGLYSGKIKTLSGINITDASVIEQYNNSVRLNADKLPKLQQYIEPDVPPDELDKIRQSSWLMPDEYKNFNIAEWLLEQCTTEAETARVVNELALFLQHDMIEVLVFLKYLVDFMRANNIVWGVGRGSSVASYCLYLIGIHKINSIHYNLDIKEFLKGDNDDKTNI